MPGSRPCLALLRFRRLAPLVAALAAAGGGVRAADEPVNPLPRRSTAREQPPAEPELERPEGAPTNPPPVLPPTGYVGETGAARPLGPPPPDARIELADRWRFGIQKWNRYPKGRDVQYVEGRPIDPFNQNFLKGDYPILGGRTFLNFTATSASLFQYQRIPLPSGVSTARPGSFEFFGRGQQPVFLQTYFVTAELFRGSTSSFKPKTWSVKLSPVVNINYVNTRENNAINIDPRRRTNRTDHQEALQEAFLEVKLADLSPYYDILSVRGGIQPFLSDFRGFVFDDFNNGVRLFGNFKANRLQYNLAVFDQLEKDTNSGLNSFLRKEHQVAVANLFIQDFIRLGYTTQFSYHFNRDEASTYYDKNEIQVRPAMVGDVAPHEVRSHYLGWTGDGHFGRLNVNHAFYQVLGTDERNPIAGREVDIRAQLAALELSIDADWLRFKGSFLYTSGDSKPTNDRARGFDGILASQVFAGGPFSYVIRQGIPLTRAGVPLFNGLSFYPNLRSKTESQANYVNPGLHLYNGGVVLRLTPKLKGSVDVNYFRFDKRETLELLLFQNDLSKDFGFDINSGFLYRPLLNDNIQILFGGALFVPGRGYRDIYRSLCGDGAGCGSEAGTLYQAFTELKLTY